MKPIRIVIADDHALLRAGLRGLLAALEGVEVVGEAADGLKALELVDALHPDILMTDIAMPGLDGLGLTANVARDFSQTRVIILSMHTEPEYADGALRAGAAGYVVKDSGTAEVELAVRAIARGESYLSPAVSKHLVAGYARMAEAQTAAPDPLTPRQREVLKLIAEGLTTKAIARRLDISVKTADTHRVQLMERLGIHEVAGLDRYAIRAGLVDCDA
jgi:DNA-binding NarL/FixJ family response regulator